MRGLHVRALHGVWGIALGYEAIPASDKRSLLVTQGMAYDCHGREIVMSETLQVGFEQPPRNSAAGAWWFDLLIRYDAELGSAPAINCLGIERNAVPERPSWRWSYAGEAPTPFIKAPGFAENVRLGEEIPLARVRITEQGTLTDLDLTVRRIARSLARPHIATGQIRAGSIPIQGSPLHWRARIDTSAGGFNTFNPFYFATMIEHPLLSSTSGFADIANQLQEKAKAQLLGPFTRIESLRRTGFTIDVRMATVSADLFETLPAAMQHNTGFALPVPVNWLGIEPNGGCTPPRLSLRFLLSVFSRPGLIHL